MCGVRDRKTSIPSLTALPFFLGRVRIGVYMLSTFTFFSKYPICLLPSFPPPTVRIPSTVENAAYHHCITTLVAWPFARLTINTLYKDIKKSPLHENERS